MHWEIVLLKKNICLSLVRDGCWNLFFDACLHNWIHLSLYNNLGHGKMEEWKVSWETTCHSLWFLCNKKTHDDTFVMSFDMMSDIRNRTNFYFTSLKLQKSVIICNKVLAHIKCESSDEDKIVINFDEVSKNNGYVIVEVWDVTEEVDGLEVFSKILNGVTILVLNYGGF